MKTKIFVALVTALLLSTNGVSLAATPSGGDAMMMPNESGAMQGQMQNSNPSIMGQMMRGGMRGDGMMNGGNTMNDGMMCGGMMNGGMMNGGMMGMMGGCPMMSAGSGANGKIMMQMHGEMMRAMGDIMIKYADKFEAPAPSK